MLDEKKFAVVIERLIHQLLENNISFEKTAIIGIQPRGVLLSKRIVDYIENRLHISIEYGKLDITFYRDDFKTSNDLHLPVATEIPFSIENKKLILIDDVLYTGRTIRCALDALLDFGRPNKVELLTLIDRRWSRELPIQPDYVGLTVDSLPTQKVKVHWKEKNNKDEVLLIE